MPSINYIHGLTKEIGHVKVVDGDRYEPALYIFNETAPRFKDRSFVIALSAFSKYVNPFIRHNDPRLIAIDKDRFEKKVNRALRNRDRLNAGLPLDGNRMVSPLDKEASVRELSAAAVADALIRTMDLMPLTAYSLAMCMQQFDITPCPASAAQLLMFIEDSLDDLKNYAPPAPDKMMSAGAYEVKLNGEKVISSDWLVPASDVIEERYTIPDGTGELVQ